MRFNTSFTPSPARTSSVKAPVLSLLIAVIAASALQGCAFYDFDSCPEHYTQGAKLVCAPAR